MQEDITEKSLLCLAGGSSSTTPQLPTSKFCNNFPWPLVTLAMAIPFLQPGRRFPSDLFHCCRSGQLHQDIKLSMSFSAVAPLPATPADYHTPGKQYFITPAAAGTALTRRDPVRWDGRQYWLLFLGIVCGRREFCNHRGLCCFSFVISLHHVVWASLPYCFCLLVHRVTYGGHGTVGGTSLPACFLCCQGVPGIQNLPI